jgi:16S rRNA U1498 N3-methylase RsmE
MTYFYQPKLVSKRTILSEFSQHIMSVRPRIGEVICLTDLKGMLWQVEVKNLNKKTKEVDIQFLQEEYINKEDFWNFKKI